MSTNTFHSAAMIGLLLRVIVSTNAAQMTCYRARFIVRFLSQKSTIARSGAVASAGHAPFDADVLYPHTCRLCREDATNCRYADHEHIGVDSDVYWNNLCVCAARLGASGSTDHRPWR